MRHIAELADSRGEVQSPIARLSKQARKSVSWVSAYLRDLESRGSIAIVRGEGRGNPIARIRILKRELTRPSNPIPQPAKLLSPQPSEQKEPKRQTETGCAIERARIAVLVDFDNVIGVGRKWGCSVSFLKLREYLREFGEVALAEVVLSPKSNRGENIERLAAAQFDIYLSAQRLKDKDDVDAVIKARALRFAHHTNVATIVVVSDDGDFGKDPRFVAAIADLGKKLYPLRPSYHLREIEGKDDGIEADFSRRSKEIQKLIEESLEAGLDPISGYDQNLLDFIMCVMRAIAEITGKLDVFQKRQHFKQLQGSVWREIEERWRGGTLRESDVGDVMGALKIRGILLNHQADHLTYYRLDQNHPVVKKIVTAT